MSIFSKIFLAYFLFLSFLKAQTFEKVVPHIYILNSCSKQTHIGIDFQNTFSGFEEVKDSLTIIWKKDGQIIKTSNKKDLFVTELGKYSCQVQNLNSKINSNLLEIKEFKDTKLIMYKFPAPPQIKSFRTICLENEYYKEMSSNLSGYYFSGADKYLTAKALAELKSDTHFNWFVNDKLKNLANGDPDLSNENHDLNIRLLVTDGQCDFISNNTQVYNYAIPKKGIKKYEFCPGDTSNITMKSGFNSDFRKYIWYKDGEIFSEKIEEPKLSVNEEMYPNRRLRTTLPGKYILKTIYPNYSDGNYNFDENSCSFWSDSIEIVFKKEILLSKSNYISEIFENDQFPDYRKLQTKLCNESPVVILSTDSLTQNFEWFKNGISIPKSEYGIPNIEKKFTGYYKSNNLYFNALPIELQNYYFAKIHVSSNCVALTDTVQINSKNSFQIKNVSFCESVNYDIQNMNKGSDIDYSYTLKHKIDGNWVERSDLVKYKKGNFQVIAQKGDCILESNIVPIVMPDVNLSLSIADSLQLCVGKTAKLGLLDSTSNFQILAWNKGGSIIENTQKALEVTKSGKYNLLIKENICGNFLLSNSVKIIETPLPTVTISGSKSIDYGANAELKLDLTSTPPWQIKLNTGQEFLVEKTPFNITVKPQIDTKYTLESVKNICGIGASMGEATIKVIILANEPNYNEQLEMSTYPIPVNDTFDVEIRNARENKIEILLYDFSGKNVISTEIFKENGKFIKTLNMNKLAAGIYILKGEIEGKIISKKIVKN